MIKAGVRFPLETPVPGVFAEEVNAWFKPIRKECFEDYLGMAVRLSSQDV